MTIGITPCVQKTHGKESPFATRQVAASAPTPRCFPRKLCNIWCNTWHTICADSSVN